MSGSKCRPQYATIPQSRRESYFPIPVTCTGGRRNLATCSTNQKGGKTVCSHLKGRRCSPCLRYLLPSFRVGVQGLGCCVLSAARRSSGICTGASVTSQLLVLPAHTPPFPALQLWWPSSCGGPDPVLEEHLALSLSLSLSLARARSLSLSLFLSLSSLFSSSLSLLIKWHVAKGARGQRCTWPKVHVTKGARDQRCT